MNINSMVMYIFKRAVFHGGAVSVSNADRNILRHFTHYIRAIGTVPFVLKPSKDTL